MPKTDGTGRTAVRSAFGLRAFRILYFAETQSVIGDQLARLALSVLVFDRTNSTLASALTYAVTFLPAVLGGFALGGLGDRYPRRRVMVGVDIVRAVLFGLMAVPSLPLGVVIAVLAVAVLLGPAFSSAQVGYLAAALDHETFRAATAVRSASGQLAQVAGFAVGGVVVAALDPRGALLVDAATFAFSALLITIGLNAVERADRHADGSGAAEEAGAVALAAPEDEPEFAGLWRTPRTRAFLGLTVLIGLFVVPEGLGVPFARMIGASTTETGVLIAMIPLGGALGAALIVRVAADVRRQVAGWMAVGCGLPLLLSAANPSWAVACLAWFASGVLAAYQVEASTVLVQSIPPAIRSRLVGVVGALLLGAQGAGFAIAGLIASLTDAGTAIAITAALGSSGALVLVLGPMSRVAGAVPPQRS